MLPEQHEHVRLHELMLENQRLLTENNQLLKKLHRSAVWAFWLRVFWILFLLGAPFALYYFVLEPYFASFGSSIEVFQQGVQEIPGWKQFHEAFTNNQGGGE